MGVEALVRWRHPQRGLLLPRDFLDIAEANGLMIHVFRRVVDQALDQYAELTLRLPHDLFVAINLSARQLGDGDVVEVIADGLTKREIPPEKLWIEITESALATRGQASLGVLDELHAFGVKFAIDDFGTGWSTLARLADGPWDVLKIDRRFVTAINDRASQAIVTGSLAMARSLGLTTVAEGVERQEQRDRLAQLGCELAQGFLFAKPTNVTTIAARVSPDGRWLKG